MPAGEFSRDLHQESAVSWSGWPRAGPGKGTLPDMAAFRLTRIVLPKTPQEDHFYGFFLVLFPLADLF